MYNKIFKFAVSIIGATRCTIPRESVLTGSSARRSSTPRQARSSAHPLLHRRAGARGSAGSPRRQLAVEQRFVARGSRSPPHLPRPHPGSRLPSTAPSPAWGRSSVASTRNSVVLPAPLGPNTTSVRPGPSEVTLRSAPRVRRSGGRGRQLDRRPGHGRTTDDHQ